MAAGAVKQKLKIDNTHEAIVFFLDGVRKTLVGLRVKSNPVLTLQAITYLFAGNPTAMLGDEGLWNECCSIAETVRMRQMEKFKSYGCDGPQAIERMIGNDRLESEAAGQALMRFTMMVKSAMETLKNEQAMKQVVAQPGEPVAAMTEAETERFVELARIQTTAERELTAEEQTELVVLREKMRAGIVAKQDHAVIEDATTAVQVVEDAAAADQNG